MGLFVSGIILTIQTFFTSIYIVLVSHGHRLDFFSSIVSNVSNLFGFNSSVNEGILFIQSYQNIIPFTVTYEKLGIFIWFNIFISSLILFFLLVNKKQIIKYIVSFLLFSFLFLIFRFTFISHLYTQSFYNKGIFWDPIILFISFIPFSLILMKYASFNNSKIEYKKLANFNYSKRILISLIIIFILVFSLVGAITFQDPGTEKQGRILIDELHSDWENTTIVFDKEWYGQLSTYNYYTWYRMLNKYYTVNINTDELLTKDLLNDYDVLILKCPTNPYSQNEVNDIVNFVENGGGLYLIGDHTDVFGMNTRLNKLSQKFGIIFNTDSTYELGTGQTSIYDPSEIFPHPIIQNMDNFYFLTSCTLEAPINSENVIIGNKLLGEPGTYSTENFFREYSEDLDNEYGFLLQVVALKHGKGRVVAFTDSTCFSNFCIYMDGYENFNLGTIEYLNRENTFDFLNIIFIIISIISLLLLFLLLKSNSKIIILSILIIIGLLSFSVSAVFFTYLNEANYPLPDPIKEHNQVCIDMLHSNIVITPSPYERMLSNFNYNVFYIWTQRVNLSSSMEYSLSNAISKGDAIIIINPDVPFSNNEISRLKQYVYNGGKILLMDSIQNAKSTSNTLLQHFNLQLNSFFERNKLYDYLNISLNDSYIGDIGSVSLNIMGGQKIILDENNATKISCVNYGEGIVVVVVDSYTFSDNVMGGSFTVPDSNLRRIYNTEYYIFEELLFN